MSKQADIRFEKATDAAGVRSANERAFEGSVEADIVDALRRDCPDLVSLVADDHGVVGHILFSPAVVESGDWRVAGMGLAPLAVVPERQGGIGSALVERGLAELRERGCPFVVVLGHPGYYPRFGFEPASSRGMVCQWEGIPEEAFMVLVMDEVAMDGVSGVARYRHEFDAAV
ncbi:MAG: N-acetyltransferase [Actinobacteria bacterium]|nr:N-acetyltransferase [Actinomycetota bacterium]